MMGKITMNSLNFIPGVGKSDMEMPEHVWVAHNGLGNSIKTQGPGGRQDVLDNHFGFWNWLKYVGMGKTLILRYKVALVEHNHQVEGHRGLTNLLGSEVVKKWELMCVAWEKCEYLKKGDNPYATSGACAFFHYLHNAYWFLLMEAQVHREFADDEEQHLAAGEEPLHHHSTMH
jgi:hypothetical protein